MDVSYEFATLAQTEDLVRLRLAYLDEDFGAMDDDSRAAVSSALPGYFEEHLGTDLHALVAWADGKAVGTSWLLRVAKPVSVAFIHGLTGSLFNVYVDPAYRRQGIARELMRRVIERSEELGLDRLELRATQMGYNLYRSIGFVEDDPTHRAMNLRLRS